MVSLNVSAIARAMGDPRAGARLADAASPGASTLERHSVLGPLRRMVEDDESSSRTASHVLFAASWADRVLFLADGRIVDRLHRPTAASSPTASPWLER